MIVLGASDLHLLEYSQDLTQAGIAYLGRHLHHIGGQRRNLGFNALRQQVAEKAAELTLIRHLSQMNVPHDISAARSLAARASGISLGERPVFLHVQLVSQPRTMARLSQDPASHLEQAFPLNEDILEDAQALEGVHLALRLLGRVTKGPRELMEPHYLMIPMGPEWARPRAWRPLGELAFKLEAGNPLEVEVGGLDMERRFLQDSLQLAPGQRQTLDSGLFSLSYLRAAALPEARLGVHSAGAGLRQIAAPKEWGNLWVYGQQIVLLGYLSGRDLLTRRRRRAGLPVEDLRPLDELFRRAKTWAAKG